ncbi:SH3 domain protein [Trypanosoma cruzi]|nr:SH3 domain protein [Trypanosoma cruzi]
MKADDGGHTHSATHHQSPQKSSHRTADASSDRSNCPTQSTRREEEMAREMWVKSNWEQRMSLAGQVSKFCRTHAPPINKESCAAFLMAMLDVAPPTRLQHARMLRSMLEMD